MLVCEKFYRGIGSSEVMDSVVVRGENIAGGFYV